MFLRIWGAGLIILSCAAVGLRRASAFTQLERDMKEIICSLRFMIAELEYRRTPLPELCHRVSLQVTGEVAHFFAALAQELICQVNPNAFCCVQAALARTDRLSDTAKEVLMEMGKTLGEFDINGQLQALDHLLCECNQKASELRAQKKEKLRNYKTISICAGAFLAILLL